MIVNVICVKWGESYDVEYVNNLYCMVKRNISLPFRFICLTDNFKGLLSDIEAKPFYNSQLKGWWSKIEIFRKPLYDFEGPMLFIDLDMLIVDNIDCFFNYYDDFFCMKEDFKTHGFSSCVMRLPVNEYSHIYDNLDLSKIDHALHHSDKNFKKHKFWGDQIWITEQMKNDSLGRKVVTWPKKWITKYRECLVDESTGRRFLQGQKVAASKLKPILRIPKETKIVAFSGKGQGGENRLNRQYIDKWWNCKDVCL